ncbi:hypothetical protein FQN57_002074 [Myotisia sp. PD_48]|nr:hypothetical protein FQN57_002074 [Myotisia sp. PD_48]
MAHEDSSPRIELYDSAATLPSDSEIYSTNNDLSSPPESSDVSPVIVYSPPTFWRIFRGAAINLLLPFINGLMLGFGELFAHEAAFRLGWSNTKIFPTYRRTQRPAGAGIDPGEAPRRRFSRGDGFDLDSAASLE